MGSASWIVPVSFDNSKLSVAKPYSDIDAISYDDSIFSFISDFVISKSFLFYTFSESSYIPDNDES